MTNAIPVTPGSKLVCSFGVGLYERVSVWLAVCVVEKQGIDSVNHSVYVRLGGFLFGCMRVVDGFN